MAHGDEHGRVILGAGKLADFSSAKGHPMRGLLASAEARQARREHG